MGHEAGNPGNSGSAAVGGVAGPAGSLPVHPWRRFVAVGDSFTEGLDDPDPRRPGSYRGWADRVAEELSVGVGDFAYANLAVRGQVLHEVVDSQLGPALTLKPDLVSLQAGGNDLLHAGADPDKLAAILEGAVESLSFQGVTVLIFVGPDSGRSTVLGQFRTKIAVYNENLRSIAEHHDALIADLWAMTELHDPRMWGADRLHPSSMGHHAVAAMVLETLNVPHSLVPLRPKPLPEQSWREARAGDVLWAREYLVPWMLNGIRHQSPSAGFSAKRPVPAPIDEAVPGSVEPGSLGQASAPHPSAPHPSAPHPSAPHPSAAAESTHLKRGRIFGNAVPPPAE
ncbi:SGNH/GDSL hydrolase family protein [Specibacter sp. AOP5-B1-6]|uniref:SGNH/GDSL hydrolase family protein n=1 Tax=Specibacter sp. AOP5-B1-6 TaxID=3457653 RepID=UPI00402B27D5